MIAGRHLSKIIILDRDGVLNEIVIDPEQGTVDSPMSPTQVRLIDGATEALIKLTELGFALGIATNQPAAAKKKTTSKLLQEVHQNVLKEIQAGGVKFAGSAICFHQASDLCECRKPKTGLLEKLFETGTYDKSQSWMVGDGLSDIEAGHAFGLKTAFLGPQKWDAQKIFEQKNIRPSFWGSNLLEFANFLAKGSRHGIF
jgi:D-glycero-D-manno-heptose 1,7-bisphosphate phosphatase